MWPQPVYKISDTRQHHLKVTKLSVDQPVFAPCALEEVMTEFCHQSTFKDFKDCILFQSNNSFRRQISKAFLNVYFSRHETSVGSQ